MTACERPVIIAGDGIRLAGAKDLFRSTVDRLGTPVTTAWAHDAIEHDNPCYCGKQGTTGSRAGSFIYPTDFALGSDGSIYFADG